MDPITVEAWDKLGKEEQLARLDERPEGGVDPNAEIKDEDKDKEKEPTLAELKQQLADTNKRISDMEGKHKQEKDGLAFDLRREREKRQELEEKLAGKGKETEDDPLKDRTDEDLITVKDVKAIMQKQQTERDKERKAMLVEKVTDRMDTDEERMIKATAETSEAYPVPFEEAMKAFGKLAEKDKSLWDEINREALRPRGRPAEKVYRIALLSDPDLSKLVTQKQREKIIAELNKKPEHPKKLGGGGAGKGEIDLSKLGDKEILELAEKDPDALDAALQK